MPFALRAAAPPDAPAIATLINRAFQVEAFFVDGDRTSTTEIRSMFDGGTFLLAEDSGALLACVFVDTRGDRGYFGLLAVEPSRQGQGLGRALVDAAEDLCRRAGCRAVDIRVVDIRRELQPLYERLGYRPTGSEPFSETARAKIPCRFVVMSKDLS